MANYFWGYPTRFAARLQEEGTTVYLWLQHNPVAPHYKTVTQQGIGVVTGDIGFMAEMP
jgi:hypothetical protein